ncbi:MAG: tetratricopeptide repeat protein [Candidatus Omnitrophota bacterium]
MKKIIITIIFLLIFGFDFGLLVASPASAQEDEKENLLKAIGSKDALQRRKATNRLTEFIDNPSSPHKEDVIQKLLQKLVDPSTLLPIRINLAYSLGDMRKTFWKVPNQSDMEKQIYHLFLTEKNNTLKERLDDALMTASGLYWDAMNDYNENQVDPMEETAGKFRRVFESYPNSSYAPKAHYFLASYYTKAYFILKKSAKRNPKTDWIIEKSNGIFKDFISKIENKTYSNDRLQEARYFLALNHLTTNQFPEAQSLLQRIIDDPLSKTQRIYVYQFFYSPEKDDIIDDYLEPGRLARYTLDYLKKNPVFNAETLTHLSAYLKKYPQTEHK